MKTLVFYALESLACGGVLLAAYAVLLDRRVRFGWCRAYLLAAAVLTAVIPLLRIPVWPGGTVEALPTVAVPDDGWTAVALEGEAPVAIPVAILLAIYLLGAGLIAGVMLRQVAHIRALRSGGTLVRQERFALVRTPQRIASFSFFRTIYVWEQTPPEELQAVIAHEASHIAHRHSVERVAMECLKAALWWNPFVWIMARRLTEAEEFEADRDVLAGGYDVEGYMRALFMQLFGQSPEIANGLRDSLTKKRFQMMTQKISERYALLRLAGTLPALFGLLCAFSFTARAAEIRLPETDPVEAAAAPKSRTVRLAVEKDGRPLPGALVTVAGTKRGSVTDAEGKARIDAAQGATLAVSYIDCQTVEVRPAAGSTEEIRVVLHSSSSEAATKDADDAEPPFLVVEVMPRFQGGDLIAFRQWVQGQVRYPEAAMKKGIQGRVILKFVVERDGSVSNVKIVQSPDESLSAEARRVISSSPAWTPGQQRNRPVRVEFTLPVDFKLQQSPEQAGEKSAVPEDDSPFLVVETMPRFQGGALNDFRQWVLGQVRYPEAAIKKGVQGRVVVSFVIERDGSVSSIEIVQSPDESLSAEARRVISSSPAWTPGQQRNRPVRVKFTIPVDFHMQQPATAAPAR